MRKEFIRRFRQRDRNGAYRECTEEQHCLPLSGSSGQRDKRVEANDGMIFNSNAAVGGLEGISPVGPTICACPLIYFLTVDYRLVSAS